MTESSANMLTTVRDQLTQLRRAVSEIQRCASLDELEAKRIELTGRKAGKLTGLLRDLAALPAAERPLVGAEINQVKALLTEALDARAAELQNTRPAGDRLDLTLPGRRRWIGARHPVTHVVDEICAVLGSLGFTRVRSPEIESDWYNFTALNTPLDHPSADMHDTFYIAPGLLLRSHTSPGQIRTMQKFQPPVRVAVPGLVYRRDPFDASHAPAFEQLEGLAVDEGISFVDLKATIAEFARRFFGADARVRFRPSFFPFTEPSAEVDVLCGTCHGSGCSVCKGTGWVEIMGAGMVHPAVFRNVGYDEERYTGFAFGMGPGRIALARHGLPDIRLLYDSDVRFLEQFA